GGRRVGRCKEGQDSTPPYPGARAIERVYRSPRESANPERPPAPQRWRAGGAERPTPESNTDSTAGSRARRRPEGRAGGGSPGAPRAADSTGQSRPAVEPARLGLDTPGATGGPTGETVGLRPESGLILGSERIPMVPNGSIKETRRVLLIENTPADRLLLRNW